MNNSKPIILAILDGWGEWDIERGNPIARANMPTIDILNNHYPKTYLQASGMAVGLPWEVRGNSEVGHQTIGSGQIIFQYLPTINASIGDGSFFENKNLLDSCNWVKEHKSNLHVFGLLSNGAVHSHIDHLVAILELAKKEKIPEVYIHVITDGRDTHPQSAQRFLEELRRHIREVGIGKIVTISGRYYTMDRNNNWDRIEKSFLAMTIGVGVKELDIFKAIENQYAKKVYDEYLEPIVLVDELGRPDKLISDNDAVICFNFRKDRSRQIIKAFATPGFSEFKKAEVPNNLKITCFVEYEKGVPVDIVFKPKEITTRLGEIISQSGKKQLRISETEKFAHVTYFFNGGAEKPYPGETRALIPSKNVPSYAEIPEMSALEITDKLIEEINKNEHDFILVNYANADMLGHTGVYQAGLKAVEFIDKCLSRLIGIVLDKGGEMIITADHGNAEEMLNIHTGEVDTKHSRNPVPCWYISPYNYMEHTEKKEKMELDGMLIDLAPTVLALLDIEKPKGMSGISLLKEFRRQSEL